MIGLHKIKPIIPNMTNLRNISMRIIIKELTSKAIRRTKIMIMPIRRIIGKMRIIMNKSMKLQTGSFPLKFKSLTLRMIIENLRMIIEKKEINYNTSNMTDSI